MFFFICFCWRPSAKQAAQPLVQCTNASTQGEPQKAPNHEQKKERTDRPDTQEEALLYQGNSGRDPRKPRRSSGNQLRPPARTRPNEQANQPEPNPDSTHSNLGRDPSRPWRECGSWTRQQAGTRTNQNGQERTRTNKRQQGLVEYQGKPRSKAPPSPSDQGHREQGSGKLLGSRREGRAPPSPSDLARLQQGHREQGSGQPASL